MFTPSWLRPLTSRRPDHRRRKSRLAVERLEDRSMPSVTAPLFNPRNLTAIGTTMYVVAGNNADLYRVDASTGTAALVRSFGHVDEMVAVGSNLFLCAEGHDANNNDVFGLWKSDGTTAGTTLVKGIPSAGSSFNLVAAGPVMYFTAYDGFHTDVWRSDGTTAGTMRLADFASGMPPISNPQSLTAVGSRLYFTAAVGVFGEQLLTFDGTAGNSVLFTTFTYFNPAQLTSAGSTLYFVAATPTYYFPGLWEAQDLNLSYIGGYNTDTIYNVASQFPDPPLSTLTAVGSNVFFTAPSSLNPFNSFLWESEGTYFPSAILNGSAQQLTAVGSTLYFTFDDSVHGRELWAIPSGGLPAMVKDIAPGPDSSNPMSLTAVGSNLYFTTYDTALGLQIWRTDGTAQGTMPVKTINGYTQITTAAAAGSDIYFGVGFNSPAGFYSNMWESDGTGQGAVPVVGQVQASTLSGIVWDDFNGDGQVDFGEQGIAGVTVTLTGTDLLGNAVSMTQTTDGDGAYVFNLPQGVYSIKENQPAGYIQGSDVVGSGGGNLVGTDQFLIPLGPGVNDENYNFGEQAVTGAVRRGQAAGVGFWDNAKGQALIKSFNGGTGTRLGDWLATTLPNMFGISARLDNSGSYLAGQTNAYVANVFLSDFQVKGIKLDAQVLATALNLYATSAALDSTGVAAQYGFTVSGDGLGAAAVSVGSDGDAFGVSNNTSVTVMDLLRATDAQAVDGVLYNGDPTKRKEANDIFSAINQAGGL